MLQFVFICETRNVLLSLQLNSEMDIRMFLLIIIKPILLSKPPKRHYENIKKDNQYKIIIYKLYIIRKIVLSLKQCLCIYRKPCTMFKKR